MEHLSQEELLLLADGELADERAPHLEGCAACRAAAGAIQGRLTAVTAQLQASEPAESPDSHSAAWARLHRAMRGCGAVSVHLAADELLLHLDDELAVDRALHLESCATCHDELLRVQALLFDVEHELRALIPPEPLERRRTAAAALEQRLYPSKKVISFPLRWGAVYAAAATLTFAVFGGLWTSQQPAPVAEGPLALLNPPVPAVALPALVGGGTGLVEMPPTPVESVIETAAAVDGMPPGAPQRYEPAVSGAPLNPERPALIPAASPNIDPVTPKALGLVWTVPALVANQLAAPPPLTPPSAPPVESEAADPALLLAGLRAGVRTGAWTMDVSPEIRAGVLTFSGRVGSLRDRNWLIDAVRRQLEDRDVEFDIEIVSGVARLDESGSSRSLGDRPAGGLMRTALLAHYGDAARRSFQQPAPSALEAEIDRFATEIYRSQSSLVRHAHALSGLLGRFQTKSLTPETSATLGALVRFHAAGVTDSEARIYSHLSGALPRRYWNHRGDRQSPSDTDARESAAALLDDALRLDETLTTLLGSTARPVEAGEAEASAGALLYRIRTRAKNFESGLDRVR